jgi:peptidoglycan/LPS O-acetylase OafA/YrhL
MNDDSRHRHYLRTFDGWRAIAVSLVVLEHLRYRNFIGPVPGMETWRLGALGVNTFFVLSGFLITYLILKEKESRGSFSLTGFWIRRLCRIVPLTWFYVAAVSLLTALGLGLCHRHDLPPALFFYYNYYTVAHWSPPGWSWSLVHTWTLAVEMQFYLIWSLLLWVGRCRGAAWYALTCAVTLALWRMIQHQHDNTIALWRTDFRADYLFYGAFFGSLYFSALGRAGLCTVLRPWMIPVLIVFIVGTYHFKLPGCLVLQPILFGAVITGTLLHAELPAYRWMEWAPLTWLGRVSFSAYIWQQLVLLKPNLFLPFPQLNIPLSLAAILLIAGLSNRLIEQPSIRLGFHITRFLHERDHPVASSA